MEPTESFKLIKALGDRTRFEIVFILLKGEKCACEIPKIVKRAQPTVSLQLKYLVKVGILNYRKDGKKVIYHVSNKKVEKILRILQC